MTEEIEAGVQLAREFDKYKPLKAVFWLKTDDEDQRYLYLASDQIDDTNFDLGIGEVFRLSQQPHLSAINPFRVKVVSGGDALTLAAVRSAKWSGGLTATRLGGCPFGDLFIDDGYVYPTPLPAPPWPRGS